MQRLLLLWPMVMMLCGCSVADQPVFVEYRRPQSVPPQAVLAPGPKGGWWQYCAASNREAATLNCEVYNWKGELLYREEFEALDEKPVQPKEISIDNRAKLNGSSWINLRNGRVLIPRSRAEEMRRFFSKQIGQ